MGSVAVSKNGMGWDQLLRYEWSEFPYLRKELGGPQEEAERAREEADT